MDTENGDLISLSEVEAQEEPRELSEEAKDLLASETVCTNNGLSNRQVLTLVSPWTGATVHVSSPSSPLLIRRSWVLCMYQKFQVTTRRYWSERYDQIKLY
jgi:hypothetical protein